MATRKPRSDAEEVKALYEKLPEVVKPSALKILRLLNKGNHLRSVEAVNSIKQLQQGLLYLMEAEDRLEDRKTKRVPLDMIHVPPIGKSMDLSAENLNVR